MPGSSPTVREGLKFWRLRCRGSSPTVREGLKVLEVQMKTTRILFMIAAMAILSSAAMAQTPTDANKTRQRFATKGDPTAVRYEGDEEAFVSRRQARAARMTFWCRRL